MNINHNFNRMVDIYACFALLYFGIVKIDKNIIMD